MCEADIVDEGWLPFIPEVKGFTQPCASVNSRNHMCSIFRRKNNSLSHIARN